MRTFAFISYARSDASPEARRIQYLLEHFSIPRALVPEGRVLPEGRYLRKVFVDTSDLPVSDGDFSEDIRKALDEAEYLIVLCSRQSARGDSFVHREISYFLERHGGDTARVLPVALDGIGDSSVPAEVQPLVKSRNIPFWSREWRLRRREDKAGERAAFFKLLEFLLGVKSDVLNNRYWMEWRRKLLVTLGLSSVVLLGLIALLVYGIINRQKAVQQERERTLFERDVFPKSVDFAYMAAFARPLIRDCTNRDCIVVAAMPKDYNELTNTPTARVTAILRDAKSFGWVYSPTNIPCKEKKWGIGTVELTPTEWKLSGASVYMDPANILSSVREVVDHLTTHSPYYSADDRERLASDYIDKFETCLVDLLSDEPSLRGRKWKYYFVSTRQELENALTEIRARYQVK